MKGIFGIGGALALGIVVILGALYVRAQATPSSADGAVVVATAPTRSAVETKDTDGDGVQDWEEDLQGIAFQTITVPTSTMALAENIEAYTPPTTLTGKFSEAFFQDYLDGKIKGQDFSDPTAFVEQAVSAVEQNTQSRRHSQVELTIIADSPEAIRNYGNEVANVLKEHAIQNENEAVILQKALAANDPEMLKALAPIQGVYEATIPDMLHVPVPIALVPAHLNLLNAVEALLTDVVAMQVAFTDPLYALARAKGYAGDLDQLYGSFAGIQIVLNQNGTVYTNDEPGAFFSLFNI